MQSLTFNHEELESLADALMRANWYYNERIDECLEERRDGMAEYWRSQKREAAELAARVNAAVVENDRKKITAYYEGVAQEEA